MLLLRAFEMDPDFRMLALEDEDLRPLWEASAHNLE